MYIVSMKWELFLAKWVIVSVNWEVLLTKRVIVSVNWELFLMEWVTVVRLKYLQCYKNFSHAQCLRTICLMLNIKL